MSAKSAALHIHSLPSTQAWTPGSRMWVASAPANSLWSRKLDWYLNFRMSKGLAHQSITRDEALEKILNRIEWKIPGHSDTDQKPLLIATGLWLPCDWLLVLEDLTHEKSKLAAHLDQLATAWSDLGEPKLRLFAPSQFSKDLLAERWTNHELPSDFEIVLE